MSARVTNGAVGRRYRRFGPEAAEHDSCNDYSARRPGQRIRSQRSRQGRSRSGSRMLGDVQCLPVCLHRDVPSSVTWIADSAESVNTKNYTIAHVGMCHLHQSMRHFLMTSLVSSALRTLGT